MWKDIAIKYHTFKTYIDENGIKSRNLKSILVAYPIMLLKKLNGDEFVINLYQTSNGGEESSERFQGEEEDDGQTSTLPLMKLTETTNSRSNMKNKNLERNV